MGVVSQLFSDIGAGLNSIIGTTNALYAVYFIAFFMGTYAIVKFGLDKTHFEGKPAKVIAFMVTVITTGAIFYGTGENTPRTPENLLDLFNGFGGFIFILFLAVAFIGAGVWIFIQNKEKNKNFAYLCLVVSIFIGSSLLIPAFYEGNTLKNAKPAKAGYIGTSDNDALMVLGDVAVWLHRISFILIFWFAGALFYEKFESYKYGDNETDTKKKKAEERKRKKDIGDIQNILRLIFDEIRQTNSHFSKKSKLLQDLRKQIENLKNNNNSGGNP